MMWLLKEVLIVQMLSFDIKSTLSSFPWYRYQNWTYQTCACNYHLYIYIYIYILQCIHCFNLKFYITIQHHYLETLKIIWSMTLFPLFCSFFNLFSSLHNNFSLIPSLDRYECIAIDSLLHCQSPSPKVCFVLPLDCLTAINCNTVLKAFGFFFNILE